jgi:hypothetical protein
VLYGQNILSKELIMSTNLDLKQTEKASYRLAAYADGTADLSLGLVFILLGLYPLSRAAFGPDWNMLFFLAVLGLIVLIQSLVKKRLGAARIGIVKFGARVKNRVRISLLITVALSALMIATWALAARGWFPSTPKWLGSYGFEILVSLIVLVIMWGMAYSLDLKRYYLYGVLLAVCFPLQAFLPIDEGAPFLAAGAIITVSGTVLLTRFLKAFPAVGESEGSND